MSMFRDLLSFQNGGLPKIYQQVEYVGNSGSSYIDTEVSNGNGVYVEAKVKYNSTGFFLCLLGSQNTRDSSNGGSQAPIMLYNRTSNYALYVGDAPVSTGLAVNLNTPQILKVCTIDGNSFVEVDGSRFTSSSADGQLRSDKNLYVFAINNGGSASFFGKGNFYYLKIYDNVGGNLLRDYIPCYRKSDGVIGMYDLVGKKFYTNNGSGTFTKGNDVTS